MKQFTVVVALLGILFGSGYLAWSLWLVVSGVAFLGLLGMYFCWHWPRYAALWAAIDLFGLAAVSGGFGPLGIFVESTWVGMVKATISLDGPSTWPMVACGIILLLYQGWVEILERGGGKLVGEFNFGLPRIKGRGNAAIVILHPSC